LKVYGIVDKTGTGEQPRPWLVPGVGESLSCILRMKRRF